MRIEVVDSHGDDLLLKDFFLLFLGFQSLESLIDNLFELFWGKSVLFAMLLSDCYLDRFAVVFVKARRFWFVDVLLDSLFVFLLGFGGVVA